MKIKNIIITIAYILILSFAVTYIFTFDEGYELNKFLMTKPVTEGKELNQLQTEEIQTTVESNSEDITNQTEVEATTEPETTTEPESTTSEAENYDYYYNDGNVRIAINKVKVPEKHQVYYVADVQLSSVEYYQSLFAYGKFSDKLRQGTTEMAELYGAIFAVSGDYYNQRSNSVVIRNGILYEDNNPERDILVMYANGDMQVIPSGECPSGEDLLKMGVINSYSFGPGIVEDGKAVTKVRYTSDYIEYEHPRMLVGQVDKLHYLFVAVDGRRDDAWGMNIYDCGKLMEELGCKTAYNLDGGGSSTMVFMGKIVNIPSQGSERAISDAIGILGGED